MQDVKFNRRLIGYLQKRFSELRWNQLKDPRIRKPRKWNLSTLLKATVLGLVTGRKSLTELELQSTGGLCSWVQNFLGLYRRVPDTSIRDVLVRIEPDDARLLLYDSIRAAHRRGALQPVGLPFGVLAMDGKSTTTHLEHQNYAQKLSDFEGERAIHQVRTITCCLTSARAQVCMDAIPLPSHTNEKGFFREAVEQVLQAYRGLHLFRMITYDAGACTKENMTFLHQKGLFGFMRIKKDQPTLLGEAQKRLGELTEKEAVAKTEEKVSGTKKVRRLLWSTTQMAGFHEWECLQSVFRVQTSVWDEARQAWVALSDPQDEAKDGNRYFISNASVETFQPVGWLQVVRQHWGVENSCHWTLDAIFAEDKRPWIVQPQGMLVILILRRLAYNLLALFRSVTQRSEDRRGHDADLRQIVKNF